MEKNLVFIECSKCGAQISSDSCNQYGDYYCEKCGYDGNTVADEPDV